MKTSCINHPADEPLIKIHKWQLEACDNNACAAALLSFFEYWHNFCIARSIKARQENDIAEKHGDQRRKNEGLLQFHNERDLENGIMIYGKTAISDAVKLLESKNFIEVQRNPNPKYKFDRTRFFLFKPEVVNKWLISRSPENGSSSPENGSRSTDSGSPSPENGGCNKEAEITTETTTERKPCAAPSESTEESELFTLEPPQQKEPTLAQRMYSLITKLYEQKNKIKCPWGDAEWKLLHGLLKKYPDTSADEWQRCIRNLYASDAKYTSMPPRRFLGGDLFGFAAGPKGQYGDVEVPVETRKVMSASEKLKLDLEAERRAAQ